MSLGTGTWVRVAGDPFDVDAVARAFDDPPRVRFGHREDEGSWWLTAELFEGIDDAAEARSVADDLLRTINGCAQLEWGNHLPVIADQVVYFIDPERGRNEQVVLVGMAIERTRVFPPTLVAGDGQPAPQPQSVLRLREALSDADIASVMRIIGNPEPTWSELYYLVELVEQIAGRSVSDAGWISRAERSRLLRTANSRHAVGEQARHALNIAPLRNPMPVEQARRIARVVAEQLLVSRMKRAAGAG